MDLFRFPSLYRFVFPSTCNLKKQRNTFSKYEYYTYKFQSIVIWEHPTQTVSCLLIIQLIFWMMVNLCWKFYGIIFTLLLIFCTHDVWTERIWPEIRLPQADVPSYHEALSNNPRMLTTDQVDEYFNNFLLHAKMTIFRLRNLRNSHPTLFFSILSFFFGALTVVGCTISGIWLLYLVVMAIFLTPGAYIHVLPQSGKTSLKQYLKDFSALWSEYCSGGGAGDDFEEYVPKAAEKKFDEAYASVFEVADAEFPSLTDDDLATGLVAMPSFDDASVDGTAKFAADLKGTLDFSDSSSVSSEVSDIKFQRTHFNDAADELDSSEDDNERAFMPYPTPQPMPARQQPDTFLGTITSRIAIPDIGQLGRSILGLMPSTLPVAAAVAAAAALSAAPSSGSITGSQSAPSPQLHSSSPSSSSSSSSSSSKSPPVASKKHYSTDDEFEMINESDIN